MSNDDRALLACPRCRGPVRVSANDLDCDRCGPVGRLVDGVFDFIGGNDYAASFGREWKRHRATQLDSKNGTRISHDQFSRVTGWSTLSGKTVLDAGSGSGRYTEVALALGGCVVSLDLSEAAYVTRSNVPADCACTVVRGSLLDPPLCDASFDAVFCIGVLQHTPDPLGAARRLVRLVRPGGDIAIWMYGKSWYTPLTPKMLLRRVSRHLPDRALAPTVRGMVTALTPVARVAAALPSRQARRIATAMLPIASYWGSLPLSPEQQREWSVLDTYDWLSPKYDSPQTFEALRDALDEAGAVEIRRLPAAGLTVHARRRA